MKTTSKKFNSLHEFSQFIENNTPAGFFAGWDSERLASGLTGRKYSKEKGTKDFATANKLMLNGWKEGAERVQKFMSESIQATAAKSQTRRGPVGFAPCVPAYIQGHPCNMYNKKRVRVPARVVTIFYNCAVDWRVDAQRIEKAAAALFNVITGFEAAGVRVELWVGEMSRDKTNTEIAAFAVKVKTASQPFNLLKMIYPIVHPSFLRRHAFAWLERAGVDSDNAWGAYGYCLPKEKQAAAVASLGVKTNNVIDFYMIDGKSEKEITAMIK